MVTVAIEHRPHFRNTCSMKVISETNASTFDKPRYVAVYLTTCAIQAYNTHD